MVARNLLVDSDQGGWHYGKGYSLQLIDRMSQYPPELQPQFPSMEVIRHWKVKVAFPDGSLHEFLPRGFGTVQDGYYDVRPDGYRTQWDPDGVARDHPYLTNTLTYYSFDGTYIRLDIQHDSTEVWGDNPWTLYFPDGTKVTNYGTRITDRNGNYVEFSNITYNGHAATQLSDQLGRKTVIEYGGFSGGDVIHVPGVGGADLTYQIHWKAIQVFKTYATVIDDHYSPDGYPEVLALQFVVSRIDLPSQSGGLNYLFGYNAADYTGAPCCPPSYGWGELNSVTTPTGAQAQYQYQLDAQNGPGFSYSWDVVLKKRVTRKSLTYQQQYDGNSTLVTETWNYNEDNGSIVNPDGGIVTQLSDSQRNYRTQQPDGTVSEKVWEANLPQGFPFTSAIGEYDPDRVNGFVKTEFTSIRDASGILTKTAIKDYSYDKNGNVTGVSEYDWVDYASVPRGGWALLPTGIPGNAVLKRVTTNSYFNGTADSSDSISNHATSYWNSTSPNLKNAIASSEVSNGSATLSRAEFFYDDPVSTGNLIQQKSWDSTKGGYSNPLSGANSVSVSHQYDAYGNPTLTTDARGYHTQRYYGSVGGYTDLYPTQIKTAYQTGVQRTETREYDFSTGLVTRGTDVDNNVSSATVYDVFGRPTLVKAAENKDEEIHTSTEYSDVDRRIIVRGDLTAKDDGKLVSIQHYDQLGRIRLARQLEDAATQNAYDETQGIKSQSRYLVSNPCQPNSTPECLNDNASSLGSYQLVSNPYRAAYSSSASGETTMGWTRVRNDRGGRMVETQTFGGQSLPAPWAGNITSTGTITTFYDAELTTVTDQSLKKRQSVTDALGRLIKVYEAPNDYNYLTSYDYDGLNNLTTVTQGTQTPRTFSYDSLKRLTSANNPESGTVSYSYDPNGNLASKTDARSITTSFVYDALNRVISRSYDPSNTPAVTYSYDSASTYGKGRLAAVSSTVSTNSYSGYDAMGRVKGGSQQLGQQVYMMSYEYNLAGHVTKLTYPSGRTVNYTYDNAGRTTLFAGKLGDNEQRTYASSIAYSALGGMTNEQFGTDTAIHHQLNYNTRGQLWDVRVGTGFDGNTNWNRGALQSFYDQAGSVGGSNPDNNGNVTAAKHYRPLDEQSSTWTITTDSYGYDSLNRVTSVTEKYVEKLTPGGPASTEAQQFVQGYDYDRYGNRTILEAPPNTNDGINRKQFTVNTANNRLGVPVGQTGTMSYDDAGNLTTDTYSGAGVTRAYDAENRMTQETQANSVVSGTYAYNGDGHRVKRVTLVSGQPSAVETGQVYGMGGELLAEYAANGSPSTPQKEYGYRNGQLLVEVTAATAGWGAPPAFTPPATLLSGMEIKVEHLTELRAAVNQLRVKAGVGTTTWIPDPTPQGGVTFIKADHILQLRTKLEEALLALQLPTGGYAHPNLAATTSLIYAIDFQELRQQVLDAWNSGSGGLAIRWLVTDQLGTPRIIIDQTGTLANVKRHDYLPFGEELTTQGLRDTMPGYSGDNVRQKFTSKERDIETGLDYSINRYYSSTQGRFTSADPIPMTTQRWKNSTGLPQDWDKLREHGSGG